MSTSSDVPLRTEGEPPPPIVAEAVVDLTEEDSRAIADAENEGLPPPRPPAHLLANGAATLVVMAVVLVASAYAGQQRHNVHGRQAQAVASPSRGWFEAPPMPDFKELPRIARWIPAIHDSMKGAWEACFALGAVDGVILGIVLGIVIGVVATMIVLACAKSMLTSGRRDRR